MSVSVIAGEHLPCSAQEHLGLLRQLVSALPARFPDLAALQGADAEADALLNLAHLQLHRRTRALARLSQVLHVLLLVSGISRRSVTLTGVWQVVGYASRRLLHARAHLSITGAGGCTFVD